MEKLEKVLTRTLHGGIIGEKSNNMNTRNNPIPAQNQGIWQYLRSLIDENGCHPYMDPMLG